jgi:hypothetical protein
VCPCRQAHGKWNYDLDLMLVVIEEIVKHVRYDDDSAAQKNPRMSMSRRVYTTLYAKSQIEKQCYRPKARSTWYGRIRPAGQMSTTSKAVLKKSVKTMVLHACVAEKQQRSFLRVLRMSRAPRSGKHVKPYVKDTMTFAKNISLMKEQLKVAVISRVCPAPRP